MKKYIWFIFIVLLIVGCSSKKSEPEQKLVESSKSEEKADSIVDPKPEQKVEELSQKTDEKAVENLIEDEATLWSSYRSAKAAVKQAEAENNFEKQVKHLLEAAGYAHALQRFDIEAWQYNNAGYVLIQDFKEKTDYLNVIKKLNNLKLKSEIIQYRKDTRILLSNEKKLLLEASDYLSHAKKIDSNLEKSFRTTIIANNISFVNDVLRFLIADEIE